MCFDIHHSHLGLTAVRLTIHKLYCQNSCFHSSLTSVYPGHFENLLINAVFVIVYFPAGFTVNNKNIRFGSIGKFGLSLGLEKGLASPSPLLLSTGLCGSVFALYICGKYYDRWRLARQESQSGDLGNGKRKIGLTTGTENTTCLFEKMLPVSIVNPAFKYQLPFSGSCSV